VHIAEKSSGRAKFAMFKVPVIFENADLVHGAYRAEGFIDNHSQQALKARISLGSSSTRPNPSRSDPTALDGVGNPDKVERVRLPRCSEDVRKALPTA
jgi:hypothetical protein